MERHLVQHAPSARWFLIALLCLSRASWSVEFVDELIVAAHAARLADDPAWIRLGHWQPRLIGGWKSQAQGDFFLAPDGKTNPAAELDATLRGMFGLIPLTAEQIARKSVPPACRFPARAVWLMQKLAVDPARMPHADCPQLADYFRKLEPVSVSLVFSSYYLKNPSSAFGQTFLRIHRRFAGVSKDKSEL